VCVYVCVYESGDDETNHIIIRAELTI